MVEYAVLLAGTGMGSLMSLGRTAELWLSRHQLGHGRNCGILGLIALRIATWAFRTR